MGELEAARRRAAEQEREHAADRLRVRELERATCQKEASDNEQRKSRMEMEENLNKALESKGNGPSLPGAMGI